jgi:hypothetical protein
LPTIFESQIRRFRGDAFENGKNRNQTIILVSLLYYLFIYLFIILTIYLAPFIPDKFTAASDIDRLLLFKEEWPENFVSNITVKDIIREIPDYIPMNIPSKESKLRNIDLSTHWNPLRIFFFQYFKLSAILRISSFFETIQQKIPGNYTPYKASTLFRLSYFNGNIRTISEEICLEFTRRLFTRHSYFKESFRINHEIYLFQR